MRIRSEFAAWLACAALLVPACGEGSSAPSTSPERLASASSTRPADVGASAPLVVFLGDSISAGLHLDKDAAFPTVLQKRLAKEGHPFRVVNAGVSGDTTAGGLRRLDWLLGQKPALVVVELGGNDGLRGQALASIEKNLREIVERCRAADARVLLLGMRLPPNYGDEYNNGFAALYERVAKDLELPFVPFFMHDVGGVPSLNLGDGLHPNEEGHRMLADNIEPALHKLLEELTP